MSGYDELVGKTEATPEPAPVETPTPVESAAPVASPEPSVAPVLETPAQPAPAAAPEPQEHSVPLNVLLRTREEFGGKLSQAEQRAIAAERKLAEIDRKRQEAAAQAPDILEDPQAYIAWAEQRQRDVVQKAVASVQSQQVRAVETLSRNMLVRHIGAEKVAEVEEFSRSAPTRAVDEAYASGDPYGWFYEKFEQAQKHRKAQEAAKQLESLGGKSFDEVIAERVAAALAAQGQQPAAQPAAAPVTDTRTRNPDGTFAPQPTQRHQAPSLALVNGATAPRGEEVHGGYDALFKSKRG